jgi:hypothetical protein
MPPERARIVRANGGGGGVVRLRVRPDPSRDRSVWVPGPTTHLLHNEKCFLLRRDGSDWCWVRSQRGEEGYVKAEYVVVTDEPQPQPRRIPPAKRADRAAQHDAQPTAKRQRTAPAPADAAVPAATTAAAPAAAHGPQPSSPPARAAARAVTTPVPSPSTGALTAGESASAGGAAGVAGVAASPARCAGMRVVVVEKGMFPALGKFPKPLAKFRGAGGELKFVQPDDRVMPPGTTHVVAIDWRHACDQYVELEAQHGADQKVMSRGWLVTTMIAAGNAEKPLPRDDGTSTAGERFSLVPLTEQAARPASAWPDSDESQQQTQPREDVDGVDTAAAAAAAAPSLAAPASPAAQGSPAAAAAASSAAAASPCQEGLAGWAGQDKIPLIIKQFEELQDLMDARGVDKQDGQWQNINYQRVLNCLKVRCYLT